MQQTASKITGGTLSATEWNDTVSLESQNTVVQAGITLSGGNQTQQGQAVATYAFQGSFVADSGAINAYVGTSVSTLKGPVVLFDGMGATMRVGNTNTGASTLNLSSTGAKSITLAGGGALSGGEMVANDYTSLRYHLGGDRWEMAGANFTDVNSIASIDDAKKTMRGVRTIASSSTLLLDDAGKILQASSGSTINLTVPTNSSVAYGIATFISIQRIGSGAVNIIAAGGVTVNFSDRFLASADRQYSRIYLEKIATDTWVLSGDLSLTAVTSTELPIGSIYFNGSVATNPGTLLGYGTWVAFAAGLVPIGVGTGTDDRFENDTFTLGVQEGAYRHALNSSENGPHTHTAGMTENGDNTADKPERGSGSNSGTMTTNSSGGGTAHNNIQPVIGTQMWIRTA